MCLPLVRANSLPMRSFCSRSPLLVRAPPARASSSYSRDLSASTISLFVRAPMLARSLPACVDAPARSIPSCSRDLSARVNFSYSHAPCLRCLLLLARPRLDGDLLALSSQQVCPVGGLISLSSQLVCPVGGLIPLSSHSVLFKNALSGFLPKNGMKNGQIWEESCISLR